jgi:hypothetical protein
MAEHWIVIDSSPCNIESNFGKEGRSLKSEQYALIG